MSKSCHVENGAIGKDGATVEKVKMEKNEDNCHLTRCLVCIFQLLPDCFANLTELADAD